MNEMHWFAGIALGVLANVSAEVILAVDLHKPWALLDRASRHRRIMRWVICMLGHVTIAIVGASLTTQFLFALFSISAATDFEISLLPPDAFMYGSTLAAMGFAAWAGDWLALRDVAVAQAFCFSVVTVGVAFLNLCDSGDIKLAMQFGALCGSLGMVAAGAFGIWLVVLSWVIAQVVQGSFHQPLASAVRGAITCRPPQGPLMWCGYLLALVLLKMSVLS